MCQSIRNTRSRVRSSTRLLAATKARASPNQLNNFNVSAKSHTPQPLPLCLCLHDLSPTSRYLHYVLPSCLYNPPPPPPPINVWTPNIRLRPPPIFHVSIVLISPHPLMFKFQTLDSAPTLFYVSIVLISLTPAISTVFILTYLSTWSIVYAIPLKSPDEVP